MAPNHDRDVDRDCVLYHAHVPDNGPMTRARADGVIRDAAPNATTDVASGAACGAAPSSAALDVPPTIARAMSSLIEGWGKTRAATYSRAIDSRSARRFEKHVPFPFRKTANHIRGRPG